MKKLMGLCVVLSALAGCGTPSQDGVPLPYVEWPTHAAPEPLAPLTPLVENPTNLRIPVIEAESSLIPTGIDSSGKLEVPSVQEPLQASWYEGFSEPGETGRPAVILGHVDGGGKKGIFYRLKELQSGDPIIVDDKTFTVYKMEAVPKNQVNPEIIYAPSEFAELRLITCGGQFGGARAGHYDDNIIVYARLM